MRNCVQHRVLFLFALGALQQGPKKDIVVESCGVCGCLVVICVVVFLFLGFAAGVSGGAQESIRAKPTPKPSFGTSQAQETRFWGPACERGLLGIDLGWG